MIFFDNRPASPDPQSSKVWYYDYRTNVHHTLKQKPLTYAHLEDFVACYKPNNRHVREQTWSEETPDGLGVPFHAKSFFCATKRASTCSG